MKLLKTIPNRLNLDHNANYLLACSFGPDSMALFNMLLTEKYNFSVAFVNYKTRSNSDYEEEELEKMCLKNNIAFHKKTYFIGNVSDFENVAREVRYSFFKDLAKEYSYNYLLTAHHADDSIETYLMHKKRHSLSKYEGIAGFSYSYDMYIKRPLLNCQKNSLLEYCKKNHVPYSIDYTNMDNVHLRNIIRHSIVEKMSYDEKQKILDEINTKNKMLAKIYDKYKNYEVYSSVKRNLFINLGEYKSLHLLHFLIAKYTNSDFSGKYIKEMYNIILSNQKNKIYRLDQRFSLAIQYDDFMICETENLSKKISLNVDEAREKLGFDKKLLENAAKIVSLTNFSSFKMNGIIKNTKRFLIDCKIPITLRNLWPCVVDKNNNVIYVPRYRKNYRKKRNSIFCFDVIVLYKI